MVEPAAKAGSAPSHRVSLYRRRLPNHQTSGRIGVSKPMRQERSCPLPAAPAWPPATKAGRKKKIPAGSQTPARRKRQGFSGGWQTAAARTPALPFSTCGLVLIIQYDTNAACKTDRDRSAWFRKRGHGDLLFCPQIAKLRCPLGFTSDLNVLEGADIPQM
jgi:hypothetical protein